MSDVQAYQVVRDLVREIRLAAGMRQRDTAERLGRPQSFVSKYESGERRLDILEIRAVCHACGVPLEAFVHRLEDRLSEGNRAS